MPKVEIDVGVENKQELTDLRAQVVSLQGSLDNLRRSTGGRSFSADIAAQADQASRSIAAMNQQIEETQRRSGGAGATTLGIGAAAWGAWSHYSTIRNLPQDWRAFSSGARSAWQWGRSAFGYGSEVAAAAEAAGTAGGVSAGGGVLGAAAGIGLGLGIPAALAWGTARASSFVQGELLASRRIAPWMTPAIAHDLELMQYGVRKDAPEGGLWNVYSQVYPTNPGFRQWALRAGVPVGYGDDSMDVLARVSDRLRNEPSYAERLRMVGTMFEGDPGENLTTLMGNLSYYRRLQQTEGREVTPGAERALTRWRDRWDWLMNEGDPFGIQSWAGTKYQQARAWTINRVFGPRPYGSITGTEGSTIDIDDLNPNTLWQYQQSLRRQGMSFRDASRLAATATYWDVSGTQEAMDASGATGRKISYGGGRVLDLSGDNLQKQVQSLKEATEWADRYLSTWQKKGPGVQYELEKQLGKLQDIDKTLNYLSEYDYNHESAMTPYTLQREQQADRVRKLMVTRMMAEQEYGLSGPDLQTLLAQTLPSPNLQRRMDEASTWQGWRGTYETYRPYMFGSDSTPIGLRQLRASRRGTAAAMQEEFDRTVRENPLVTGAAWANALEAQEARMSDLRGQQRLPEVQQRYSYLIQEAQMSGRQGGDPQTAERVKNLQIAMAHEIRGLFPAENEDYTRQMHLQIRQAQNTYELMQQQFQRRDWMLSLNIQGGKLKLDQGINAQLRGITMEPGQELALFEQNRIEATQTAQTQWELDVLAGTDVATRDARRDMSLRVAQGQYDISRAGYFRQRREQELQFQVRGVGARSQYAIGRIQRWALPGTEMETALRIGQIERGAMESEFDLMGDRYTGAQRDYMRGEQSMREEDRLDQVRFALNERGKRNRIEEIQQELALTERIVQYRAGPSGEYTVAEKTHKLRLEALQKEFDITKDIDSYNRQVRAEELQHQMRLLDLDEQRKRRFQSEATSLAGMMMQGGPAAGLRAYGIGMGQRMIMRGVENVAGMGWNIVRNWSPGGLIPGQTRNGELTWLGRILQGTPFGVDPGRVGHVPSVGDLASLPTRPMPDLTPWPDLGGGTTSSGPLNTNTQAEVSNTTALRSLEVSIERLIAALQNCGCGGVGGGGHGMSGPAGIPLPGWGGFSFTPALLSGGRTPTESVTSTLSFGAASPDAMMPTLNELASLPTHQTASLLSLMTGGGRGLPPLIGAGGDDLANLPLNPYTGYNPLDPFAGLGDLPTAGARTGSKTAAANRAIGKIAAAAAAAYGVYSGVRMGGVRGGLTAGASALGGLALIPGPQAPFFAAAALAMGATTMFMGDPRRHRYNEMVDTLEHARYIEPTPQHYTYTRFGEESFFTSKGTAGPTVNLTVQALDSRSILDRSVDIGNAVATAIESRQATRLNAGIRGIVRQ